MLFSAALEREDRGENCWFTYEERMDGQMHKRLDVDVYSLGIQTRLIGGGDGGVDQNV